MRTRHPFGPGLVAALGCAALLTACNNDNAKRTTAANDNTAPATQPAPRADTATQRPVTLTGCLQQGDSNSTYILTEMNEPSSRPTATSGSSASGDKVEREQLKEAQHAYRLDAKNDDDLAKLVGKRIRVSGTVTDKSDLVAGNDQNRDKNSVGTSGRTNDDRQKISESDLARVDVTSVEKVADACGSAARSKAPAKAGKHRK
jgi:hypothetical protein